MSTRYRQGDVLIEAIAQSIPAHAVELSMSGRVVLALGKDARAYAPEIES
jgi:hypothetical protein